MAERKTLNKYYPPDFDPLSIKPRRNKKPPTGLQTVRMMAPWSMRCVSCNEYIYKGKKFNVRKEKSNESYMNIQKINFYFRCPRCASEIKIRTDPKNADYEPVSGVVRNYDPVRRNEVNHEQTLEERLEELEKEQREGEEEDEENAIAKLEAKLLDTKREQEISEELDNIRSANARIEAANAQGILSDSVNSKIIEKEKEIQKQQDKEDSELARKAFRNADGEKIRRLDINTTDASNILLSTTKGIISNNVLPQTKNRVRKKTISGVKRKGNSLGVIVKKKSLV